MNCKFQHFQRTNCRAMAGSSSCLVLALLFTVVSLQGCEADNFASQINMLSMALLVFGIMAVGALLIIGCLAMHRPPGKAKRTCLTMGLPSFIAMVVIWVGYGVLVAHMNCGMLRSYAPESCEWLEPAPGGLTLNDCCVSLPVTAAPSE